MRGRHRPGVARTLLDEHRGRQSLAAISRSAGESSRWLSDVLALRSPTPPRLPTVDQVNRVAAAVEVSPATLLVALAKDRGLVGDDVTSRHVAMGAAFRRLSPAGQRVALETVRAMGEVPGLAARLSLKK